MNVDEKIQETAGSIEAFSPEIEYMMRMLVIVSGIPECYANMVRMIADLARSEGKSQALDEVKALLDMKANIH